jgi:hypothetical protein
MRFSSLRSKDGNQFDDVEYKIKISGLLFTHSFLCASATRTQTIREGIS